MKRISLVICLILLVKNSVFAQLADKAATVETKNLYAALWRIHGKKVLFGHQDDMAYGIGWKYTPGRSDVKDLTGEYPAVLGWDVAGLEKGNANNLDGVPFSKMINFIKTGYVLGAVNTISWHMDNPLNGNSAWDTTSNLTVKEMLPGGSVNQKYKSWLNAFAEFAKGLKGTDGKLIPILFRPFHEHSGSWFWWGKKHCTAEEYKGLWRFTVEYLRDAQQVHNLIYVFNPNDFKDEKEYLERYPGDAYADVLSFDTYQTGPISGSEAFKQELSKKLDIQSKIAKRQKKLTAIAEMGYVEIPDRNWWSEVVWKSIEFNKPSYLMVWRNAGYREQEKDNHYYAPYPGHPSSEDFLKLIKGQKFLLQKGIKKEKIYSDTKTTKK